MTRPGVALSAAWLAAALMAGAAEGQTVRGTVVDGVNGRPVSLAGVSLLDHQRNHVVVAVTDSLGRYTVPVPEGGEYFLVAQRFGYRDMISPLLAVSDTMAYELDLELRPEPLGLGGVQVTVRNEEVTRWLTREFGINPSAAFGFRLLQGERLAEAKARGRYRPTETLRWLYIPVSHKTQCVSINSVPRAETVTFRGLRQGAFGQPGSAPVGTVDPDAARRAETAKADDPNAGCGTLMVDDQVVANDFLDRIDMASVAAVVTLPGMVRMYTYAFDWNFR